MRKVLLIIIIIGFSSCVKEKETPQVDLQTQRAFAEAEAAKQKALAAQAEKEKIEAELKLEKEKQRIKEENAQKEEEEEAKKNKKESKLRQKLSQDALKIVQNSFNQILAEAYPLAMNKLKYISSKLIGSSSVNNGFIATVRLNYKNLFKRSHYLDLQFNYDNNGGYRSWKFVNHSDMIAPKELTVGSLLKLVK